MRPNRLSFLAVAIAIALPACDRAPEKAPARAVTRTPIPQSEAAASTEEATAAEPAQPDGAATPLAQAVPPPLMPLNIPECDKFVEKYVACVELHVPADQRARLMDELHLHRARWRELEKMQEGKVAASLSCRGVAQRLKGDLIVDYGCEF